MRTLTALLTGVTVLVGAALAQSPSPVPPSSLPIQAIPNGPDIDLGGSYVGRLVGYNNQSALLDIQLEVNGHEVTAALLNRTDRKIYRATGTRSVFPGSPVVVNLLGTSGQGSPCEGGAAEWYIVTATFVSASATTGAGGRGTVQRMICDPLARQFRPDNLNSGSLEIVRK
ncbi:hypothetical protein D3875_10505 [Deinococcus cavernae]|uniref:Uncharacterized protein n=1 Tax=Deinococcus cavernae TaxID=2320857 RepID=A0A418V791_9DEIO|nr:hypothetical protein [Deinococcus cavernae]RJF71929.1 hypothetical protein D3875_10505 [Deinococcus cavernae]